MADQHAEAPDRQCAPVEVTKIDVVKPAQVGLYRVAMLSEQAKEAYQFPDSPSSFALSSR